MTRTLSHYAQAYTLLDEAQKYPTDTRPFSGSRPPTVEQVYLKFRGNHQMLQTQSGGTSSIRDASTLTAHEVRDWNKHIYHE